MEKIRMDSLRAPLGPAPTEVGPPPTAMVRSFDETVFGWSRLRGALAKHKSRVPCTSPANYENEFVVSAHFSVRIGTQ